MSAKFQNVCPSYIILRIERTEGGNSVEPDEVAQCSKQEGVTEIIQRIFLIAH